MKFNAPKLRALLSLAIILSIYISCSQQPNEDKTISSEKTQAPEGVVTLEEAMPEETYVETVQTESGISVYTDPAFAPVSYTEPKETVFETEMTTFPVLGGITLEFDPSIELKDAVITVPNTFEVTSTEKLILGEVVTATDGSEALLFTNTVALTPDGSQLVTNTANDQQIFQNDLGVDSTGTYLFVELPEPAGFVTGKVKSSNSPVTSGIQVGTSAGNVLGMTDNNGNYSMSAGKKSAIFYSYESSTAAYGSKYTQVTDGVTTLDIDLNLPAAISAGPVNACFDSNTWTNHTLQGSVSIVPSLTPHNPAQGSGMAFITSGPGAFEEKLSSFSQTFTIPSGKTTLEIDYNFLSDEFPEWVGSVYNDLFNIVIYSKVKGAELLVNETINGSAMTFSSTMFDGETGWKHVSLDVSAYADANEEITIEFLVSDVADTIFDSAAIIDNLHFNGSSCNAGSMGVGTQPAATTEASITTTTEPVFPEADITATQTVYEEPVPLTNGDLNKNPNAGSTGNTKKNPKAFK